jgi:integrase
MAGTLLGRARAFNRLSARSVQSLKDPGRYADGAGLYLVICKDGRKAWVFRFTLNGRRHDKGLGNALLVPLAEVRERCVQMRADIRAGRNPIVQARRLPERPTFELVAREYIEAMKPSWRSVKQAAIWEQNITSYCAALLSLPVNEVDTDQVLGVLKPLWSRIPETASRVRGRVEAVLDSAKARGLRSGDNPARWKGHLALMLPKRAMLTRGHMAAAQIDDMPKIMAELTRRPSTAALALRFTILTSARTAESLFAIWPEINSASIWIVPPERMKMGKEHRVPLSRAAHEVLELAKRRQCNDYIFPSEQSGKAMSNMAMSMLLKQRMGLNITVHGFRSTFRDWVAERTNYASELAEMALAHSIANKVEAAYRRGDMLEKRRAMMEAWAQFCLGEKTS